MIAHFFFKIKTYLNYHLRAVNAHGLHSPFLFDFYNEVIAVKKEIYFTQNKSAYFSIIDHKNSYKSKKKIKVKKVVLDPVMVSKGGTKLLNTSAINFIKNKLIKIYK